MTDWTTARVTPEIQAELRLGAEQCAAHPDFPHDGIGFLVRAIPALLDAAAERDALAESVRAYGRTIDRWGLLIIAATHSEDITTPDGDGDWEVIESRLAEVPALLAERDALAAKVERVRALHFGEYVEDEDQNRCFECGDDWPCPTIRAITDPDTDDTQRSPR